MNYLTSNSPEQTVVFERPEDVVNCALAVLSDIKKTHYLCLDGWGASAVVGNRTIRDAFVAVRNRGARIRLITEVTDANAAYCKEFMKFAEVRHLDNIRGNFSVSDGKWYTAAAVAEREKPPSRLIFSTVKEIVDQHQYFFETLWGQALSAEQRIRELEDGREAEKTEIISGEEATTKAILDFVSTAQSGWSDCGDKNLASIAIRVKPINDAIRSAAGKGLKLRYLTEITEDNIEDCRQLSKLVELRHLDSVKTNFAVSDTHYIAATLLSEANPVPQVICSNARTLVEQQKYVFDALWQQSIPAADRLMELEQGIEPEFIEVITDGEKAAALIVDFAKSVRKEAQLILPQPKTMERAGKLGLWDLLIDAANNHGAEIRVISVLTEKNIELAKEIMNRAPRIKISAGPTSGSGLFIQDEKRYFRAEDKDPDADRAADAISKVIYSNSKNGVRSFKSFFETLWKQTELYEQLQAANDKLILHDRLQKEFINIAAHELRTPVQPILGIADILGSQLEAQNEKNGVWLSKEEISIVIRNAKRLERLSSDVLDIARIDSGNLKLDIQELRLEDIIVPAILDAQGQTRGEVNLTYTIAPNVLIKGDKDRLVQVISNLLSNALKFTQSGTITVEAGPEQGDRQVVVRVVDTGRGIDPDVLPKLFGRFVTKSERGTGLGLFISKKIVEAHGGEIWGDNNPDKGATFAFSIPVNAS